MIIFDFDGVLIDCLEELALTSYNLLTNSRATSLKEAPLAYWNLFHSNRHHTATPKKILALAKWCLESVESKSGAHALSLNAFLSSPTTDSHTQTASHFFEVRQRLIDEHPEKWLSLNKPFETIWQAVQRLSPNEYFILTNKNRVAVKLICQHYKLEISDHRLFTGEKGATKQQNILELDKISPRDTNYIFLDDALENLKTLTPILSGRIHSVLATWGYNSETDRLTAQKHRYELATQVEFATKYLSE